MKKYLLFLLAILPLAVFTSSCSDENDLPDVDFNITLDGAAQHEGVLYVVQGQDFGVASVEVENREAGKAAGISVAEYYWDYIFQGATVTAPYTYMFSTNEETPVGNHVLEMATTVFAVDKTIARAIVSFPVKIVASAEDIPSDATTTVKVAPKVSKSNE